MEQARRKGESCFLEYMYIYIYEFIFFGTCPPPKSGIQNFHKKGHVGVATLLTRSQEERKITLFFWGVYTPPKTNVEAENYMSEKENHIPNLDFCVQHVSFRGSIHPSESRHFFWGTTTDSRISFDNPFIITNTNPSFMNLQGIDLKPKKHTILVAINSSPIIHTHS